MWWRAETEDADGNVGRRLGSQETGNTGKNVARPRVGINGVHCTPYSRQSGGSPGIPGFLVVVVVVGGALEVSVPSSEGIIESEKGKKEKGKQKKKEIKEQIRKRVRRTTNENSETN